MNFNNYCEITMNHFFGVEEIQLNSLEVKRVYEEKFQLEWMATKLKINSFITRMDKIGYEDIVSYSSSCIGHALEIQKGLPRGMHNGIVSFNILVSENICQEAIDFVTSRPKKRFAAFEMPIIYDLHKEQIYYYKGTPLWGSMYYKYFREYIEKNFNS